MRKVLGRPLLSITVVHTLAWGLMLLNGGRYWDDWVMVDMSTATARLMGDMAGQPWQPYVWLFVARVQGAEYILHALTFGLFLLCALLLNRLLRMTPGVNDQAQVLVPMLFAVFPVNAARIAHIDFPYTFSLALFFVAWYLIVRDLDRPVLWRKLLASALLAFGIVATNSLAVFIVLPLAHVLWLRREELRDRTGWMRVGLRHGYLVAVPIATFAVKHFALRPWGLYEGYNSIQPILIAWAIWNIPEALWRSVLVPGWPAALLALATLLVGAAWLPRQTERPKLRPAAVTVLLGLAVFALGVFPYMAVGKMPQSTGGGWWESRHQLLVPLGAAILVYGVVWWLVRLIRRPERLVTPVALALCAGFVALDAAMLLDYQVDWYKQVSLMQHMASSEDMRAGNYFVIEDHTVHLNAMDRRLLPYEYSGMMYEEFGDATRFAWDEVLGHDYASQLSAYQEYRQYHWWAWEPPIRNYRVRITAGSTDLTRPSTLLDLMWREHFDRDGFEQRVHDVLVVETTKVE